MARHIENYEDLSHEARELILYMENERAWHDAIMWVNGTLARHWVNNAFNLDLGIKAFQHATMSAAKQYHLEHGTMSNSFASVFPKHVRAEVCELLARTFVAIVRQPAVWGDLGERAVKVLSKGMVAR